MNKVDVAHATWHRSSCHSQKRQQLLSALRAAFQSPLSRNIFCLILPLLLFSNFCASTKSTRCNSHQLTGSAFLHLASHPKIVAQVFLCQNSTFGQEQHCNSQRTSPKVPTPHPGCSTSHQDQKGLTPHLALLLVSIRDAFLTTYALLPSHLSENSSRILQNSLIHLKLSSS